LFIKDQKQLAKELKSVDQAFTKEEAELELGYKPTNGFFVACVLNFA